MATIGEASISLPSFAQFLRGRGADILAEWRAVRQTSARVLDHDAARTAIAAQWLERLAALAEGHSVATTETLPLSTRERDEIAPTTFLSDLALLHQVILRRAHLEHMNWGVQESELLWQAFGTALASLASTGAAVQHPPSVERHERLLGQESRALAESLDYEQTLRTHTLGCT